MKVIGLTVVAVLFLLFLLFAQRAHATGEIFGDPTTVSTESSHARTYPLGESRQVLPDGTPPLSSGCQTHDAPRCATWEALDRAETSLRHIQRTEAMMDALEDPYVDMETFQKRFYKTADKPR